MSLREEDKPKTGCSSRGLGLAAAAIGVGIGAALYYMFSKEESRETPDTEGATSAQWNVESPQTLYEDLNRSSDYITATSDMSMSDSYSSDQEGTLITDDSYHQTSRSASESDWAPDTRDDPSSSSESDANDEINSDPPQFSSPDSDANNTEIDDVINSDPVTNDLGIHHEDDDPSSSSSESNANDEINSDPVSDDLDINHEDDDPLSSSSSEYDANNEMNNSDWSIDGLDLTNLEIESSLEVPDYDPPSSSPLRRFIDRLVSPRFSTVEPMDTREDSYHSSSSSAPANSEINNSGNDDLEGWQIESSLEVPHVVSPSSTPLHFLVNRILSATHARRRERSWSLEECSICFEVILKNQEVMSLPCTHHFHQSCILPWLQEQQTCPNCRKAVD
ncbi:clumping factor A-like isoform X2 [Maniola hyperantus]|uniref:clumping factor A-like isoform X2 n=1 Tax=Aphantopus hyperantus TaxID=2795564 RepID=UPI003747D18C